MKTFLFSLMVLGGMFNGAQAQVANGSAAPAFTLISAEGKEVSLGQFRGKTVVLEWVNFGCPFVKKFYNAGEMQKLQKEFTGKGVVWLSICSSATGQQGYIAPEKLAEEVKAHQVAATAYLADAKGTVGKAYAAKTTPHMFIIDPNGVVIYQGAIDSIKSVKAEDIGKATNYVRQALAEAMEGKPVSVAQTEPYGCSVKY